MPASPGSERRKNVSACVGFTNGLGRLSTTFRVVSVSGNTPGVTRLALPCRFQLVGQQDRQLNTLNGKPLVHRPRPANDQSPISWFRNPPAPLPNLLSRPNGRSQIALTLIW